MRIIYVVIFFYIFSFSVSGQQGTSIERLFELARIHSPSYKAAAFRTRAAASDDAVISDQFKPKLQAAYQLNYATYNNITGMVFPPFVTPISGPPTTGNTYSGVFGSAAVLLARWDVATFGYKGSLLAQAGRQHVLQEAREDLAIFRNKVKITDTYLDWLLANRLITVYANNVKRAEALLHQSKTLVINGLKPGTDSASLSAEYSKANVLLEQQKRVTASTFIQLQQLVGLDTAIAATDTFMFSRLPIISVIADSSVNPELKVLALEAETNEQQIKVIERSARPQLSLFGTGYARGSGVPATNDGKDLKGLYFQRFNYGFGAQLAIPILEGARIRNRITKEQLLLSAAREDYNHLQWQLQKNIQESDTLIQSALLIASAIISQQQSSSFLFQAVSARYQAGLVSYADVVLAQQQLVQAEADVQKSRWEAWKAFLYKAALLGDVNLFTRQFR